MSNSLERDLQLQLQAVLGALALRSLLCSSRIQSQMAYKIPFPEVLLEDIAVQPNGPCSYADKDIHLHDQSPLGDQKQGEVAEVGNASKNR